MNVVVFYLGISSIYVSFFDDAILVQFTQDTLFSHKLNTIIWDLKKELWVLARDVELLYLNT